MVWISRNVKEIVQFYLLSLFLPCNYHLIYKKVGWCEFVCNMFSLQKSGILRYKLVNQGFSKCCNLKKTTLCTISFRECADMNSILSMIWGM